jgi:N-acetylglutamate synthase-like GNAT family acetyltransferase
VVNTWHGRRLVGFGRASSDTVFRAVLWDVVVACDHQGQGRGRCLVEALLQQPALTGVERMYLMASNGAVFYQQLGLEAITSQQLMLR